MQADADQATKKAKITDNAGRKQANIAGGDALQLLRGWKKRDEARLVDGRKTLDGMEHRLEALRKLEAKLVAKQSELAKWRGETVAEKGEFDRLHAEAAHGELAELIEIIPSDAVFGHLLDQGTITAESAAKLTKTFRRLKDAGKAVANTVEARNQKEYVKVQLNATQDAIKELIRISKNLPLDSPARLWDSRTVKMLEMFGATGTAMLGNFPAGEARWWERAEPAANLLADLVGIAIPPFGTGLKLERVFDREAQKRIVSRAQKSLGGALADNWNASIYLSQKLERVRSDIVEEQHSIGEQLNQQRASASR